MSDEEEVVTKPRAKKNPLMAKAKAKAAAGKVIEKASTKAKAAPAKKGRAVVDDEDDEPKAKKKRAPKAEGQGRQPREEMQEDRQALLALLKRRKNGLTSVECKNELEWTSARVAATSFGLVAAGLLTKTKDPDNGRVSFKYVS